MVYVYDDVPYYFLIRLCTESVKRVVVIYLLSCVVVNLLLSNLYRVISVYALLKYIF